MSFTALAIVIPPPNSVNYHHYLPSRTFHTCRAVIFQAYSPLRCVKMEEHSEHRRLSWAGGRRRVSHLPRGHSQNISACNSQIIHKMKAACGHLFLTYTIHLSVPPSPNRGRFRVSIRLMVLNKSSWPLFHPSFRRLHSQKRGGRTDRRTGQRAETGTFQHVGIKGLSQLHCVWGGAGATYGADADEPLKELADELSSLGFT